MPLVVRVYVCVSVRVCEGVHGGGGDGREEGG